MSLYDELCQCLDQSNVSKDEPMSRHTTFRVGGPADFFGDADGGRGSQSGCESA